MPVLTIRALSVHVTAVPGALEFDNNELAFTVETEPVDFAPDVAEVGALNRLLSREACRRSPVCGSASATTLKRGIITLLPVSRERDDLTVRGLNRAPEAAE